MFAAAAYATASTKQSLGTMWDGKKLCGESVIADVADNKAYTSHHTNTPCNSSTASSVAAGWLAAATNGYIDPERDGTYNSCGSTGQYVSGVATWRFGVGAHLCSNPGGAQNFRTLSQSWFYRPACSCLEQKGGFYSPPQTY